MLSKTDLSTVVKVIVDRQQSIIGPLAIEQANKVEGLHVSNDLGTIDVEGDNNVILENLVKKYETLFGQASVEVCKDAVREVMSQVSEKDVPIILR